MQRNNETNYIQKALELGRQRDYSGAAQLLEEVLAQQEAVEPEVVLLLGRAYHTLQQYPRALALFRDYIRLEPNTALGYFFAGRTYLALGMNQHALPLLRKALDLRPNEPQILAMLGIACLKNKRSREAVEYLQKAVELAPENQKFYRSYLNALLVRGIKLCRLGETDLGTQMLQFVLDNGLEAPLPHLELGRIYRESGHYDLALGHYSAACKLAPDDVSIRWYRATLLMALNKTQDALEEIETIRELGGEVPELSWNAELVERFMIRSFLAEGAWSRAAKACGLWLRKRGSDPMIHAMYAEALRNMGDLETAHNHLSKALEMAGQQVELRYAQLMLAWEREDWNTLHKTLTILQRLHGDPAIIQRFTALLIDHTSQDDKTVITQLQQAIRTTGPSPELMFALAQRYFHVGLPELAEGWYKRTIQVQPNHERAYLGSIASLEQLVQDDEKDAVEQLIERYKSYLERWPDNRNIRREYALFLIKHGQFEMAQTELESLFTWDVTNTTLRRLLAYVYRKNRRYRDAAILLKGVLKEDPQNIPVLLEFIGCLDRSNMKQYSYAILEKAVKHFKQSVEVALAFGDAAHRDKKIEQALDAYREAAARNTLDPRPYHRMAYIYKKQGIVEMADRYENEAKIRENVKNKLPNSKKKL
ncbi:tetratricopeptide repeat protein [Gracilinema caldarium]|uniref:Tetratricopeptide TPR_2 repeat-containing protein n=1 Tax=Gracilinema caldarium (strain ATCC 51460 / DSM 7334 / H1) TaxID=744872 RepID=F8F0E8_GRAC1|nr:tetratricopeptide repeat protein [Gracilinema caldarium]AEJ19292.1 Tetratricopeptide TPR_2 repeat-containing protein [Gracilinema caldarium DSM 7334]